jgi:diguanylate cyclase (GGDEF)-like protein
MAINRVIQVNKPSMRIQKNEGSVIESELDKFGKEILSKMTEDSIPPLPIYYSLYFEKLLDDKPLEFKKTLLEQMSLEQDDKADKTIDLEKKFKSAFANTKEILTSVSALYKQLSIIGNNAKRCMAEAKNANNPTAIINLTNSISNDMSRFSDLIGEESGKLKELYVKNATILKQVEDETVHDSFYGLYNRRYLGLQLSREVDSIKKFKHSSCLVTISMRDSVARSIGTEKGLVLVNKTLAKILLKTSRRSDIVSHIGNGVFTMLLKHTDLNSSIRASERMSDLVKSTNFFLGEKEVDLAITIGIVEIKSFVNNSTDELINFSVIAMTDCDKDEGAAYKLYESKSNG